MRLGRGLRRFLKHVPAAAEFALFVAAMVGVEVLLSPSNRYSDNG